MLVSTLARGGWAFLVALLLVTGCRSSTDRIRVLEAEKADLERRNQGLRNDQAGLRSKTLELEARLEREEAMRQAAEQAALRNTSTATDEGSDETDLTSIRNLNRDGVEVYDDGEGGATIVLASDITFKSGRADLNRAAEATLREVARAIKETGSYRDIRIEGHTDSDPIRKSGWRDNEELSLARAESVRAFLVTQGISEPELSVNGFGAARPIASNASKVGKARNRRVEIVVVGNR